MLLTGWQSLIEINTFSFNNISGVIGIKYYMIVGLKIHYH